jgi:hypothetical protein
MEGFLILFLILAFFAVVYFLPTILSVGSTDFKTVLVLNALFGWTVIGWVLVLIRSISPGYLDQRLFGNFRKLLGRGEMNDDYKHRKDNQPAGV